MSSVQLLLRILFLTACFVTFGATVAAAALNTVDVPTWQAIDESDRPSLAMILIPPHMNDQVIRSIPDAPWYTVNRMEDREKRREYSNSYADRMLGRRAARKSACLFKLCPNIY